MSEAKKAMKMITREMEKMGIYSPKKIRIMLGLATCLYSLAFYLFRDNLSLFLGITLMLWASNIERRYVG